ncbi:MAG: 16S rRNA (guanine(966)-N(2))-methyltransferase RsmD [Candidatus Eremiobacter antarcticus]|nr:16S rRNA (guanine(966)-N(2))-methyltransferase RsmD [Candidatus Eremiobacteraeota bacterium]MBC5808979.1 16S rRNA (guanine(966)-N(2))-methyltransferase RsmD [Candidatus Eremiobacteraeota bacterium]PZR60344.1 MAG: 16S rRNA (guanine(966)-N(2))-methyltransferase RsmD [Candidatus Eremiobacter sp. RRmetagenome_bin22]
MRLSGGGRSGQTLQAPKGKKTRPTSAKVREALFDVLGKRVEGARVLDLFAGSGALGFEAMSRDAGSVVFVDSDAAAVMAIRRNAVRVLPDSDRWRVLPMTAIRALRKLRGTFDIVLMDPPYQRGAAEELTMLMQRGLLSELAIVALEHPSVKETKIPPSMRVFKKTKYGDTALTFAMARTGEQTLPEDTAEEVNRQGSAASRPAASRRRRSRK